MKQIIFYTVLFFAFSTPVFAQQQSTSTISFPQKTQEIKQHIEEKKIDLSLEIQQKRQEIKSHIESGNLENKSKLQILSQERVFKIVTNVFELFEAVLVKFDGITTRIDLRISKLKEGGVNTEESENLLMIAKQKIKESTTLITASKIELQEAIKNEITKETIKSITDSCKNSLKETQNSLINVITSLKSSDLIDSETISVE